MSGDREERGALPLPGHTAEGGIGVEREGVETEKRSTRGHMALRAPLTKEKWKHAALAHRMFSARARTGRYVSLKFGTEVAEAMADRWLLRRLRRRGDCCIQRGGGAVGAR